MKWQLTVRGDVDVSSDLFGECMSLVTLKKYFLSHFDSLTVFRGEDYFRREKVISYSVAPNGHIIGLVSGSELESYRTQLYMSESKTELMDTECTCSAGQNCKHAVAVLLTYFDYLETLDPREVIGAGVVSTPQAEKKSLFEIGSEEKKANDQGKLVLPQEIKNSFMAVANYQRLAETREANSRERHNATTIVVYVLNEQSPNFAPKIDFYAVSIRKDGSFGASRTISVNSALSRRPPYLSDEDFEIFELFLMVASGGSRFHYGTATLSRDTDPDMLFVLLTRILKTRRCHFDSVEGPLLSLGKSLEGAIVWECETQGTEQSSSNGDYTPPRPMVTKHWRIGVRAKDGEREIPCLKWVAPWYIDTIDGVCGPVSWKMNKNVLNTLFGMRGLTTEETKTLPILLHSLGLTEMIPMPPEAGEVEKRLVEPVSSLGVQALVCQTDVSVGDELIAKQGERLRVAVVSAHFPRAVKEPFLSEDGKLVVEAYDKSVLNHNIEQLTALGFTRVSAFRFGKKDSPDQSFFVAKDMVDWVNVDHEAIEQLRSEGWAISSETESKLLPIEVDSESMKFEAKEDGNWWFSLALNIEVNGKRVPLLPFLISAIQSLHRSSSIGDSIESLNHNGKFIAARADGTLISLPFERIKSVLKFVQEFIEKGLSPDKLPLAEVAEILDDETLLPSKWIGIDKIISLVDRLKAIKTLTPVEPPEDFRTTLRPYQLEGLSWLQFMARNEFGGILADDMGLGKTVQLLAHLCLEKESGQLKAPYLVICPTSVLPNWLSEAERFAPQLKVVAYHGMDRASVLPQVKTADLVISTYPLLSRDGDTLNSIEWHGVVLDEAQAIKNHTTQLAKAARALKASHRFCLTGTPIENHLGELWSQFQFLLPGLLSDHSTFKQYFRDPVEKLNDHSRRLQLTRRIKPFIVRRTKQEVAAELPDKTVIVQNVELEGAQRDLYESVRLATTKRVRDEIKKKGFKQSRIMILDALLKLRQTCCHPKLVKLEAAAGTDQSAKLELLIEMLLQLTQEGRKILLFSQFTSMLEIIASELRKNELEFVTLTGDTKDRTTPVRNFQNGDVPIFLISLKAGGTGLNLTAADVVIHYDPWWNPAVEEQATDRAHRIGQTKKVFVYKLIAKGTIEQRMLALQDSKRALAGSIFDEAGNTGQAFTEDDLEALLRPIDDS
jgi:superfamily II DNA or RNA helicase